MATELRINNLIPEGFEGSVRDVDALVAEFVADCDPLEKNDVFTIFVDARTGARFCECHIRASALIPLATIDVPLDPEEQEEYRANRELVTSHQAFEDMKDDAVARRSFSNLVIEYSTDYDEEHPLKVIGGQHRYEAIRLALETDVDEYHGVKVYFGLNREQRYDVQLISNTVIAVSTDLYDRLQETNRGPELRDWCQAVGLLAPEEDFADKRQRGKLINVRLVRSFILNYYAGKKIDPHRFSEIETTPELAKTNDAEWEKLRREGTLWQDEKLKAAGREFARLIETQRSAFPEKGDVDFAEKATNYAVVAGWAYVAGLLHDNDVRLNRHFGLPDHKGHDPLNVAALIDKGKHANDGASYRGMGYRTDPKERGRFVELFFLQAERGNGISPAAVDLAVKQHVQKKNFLEVQESKKRLEAQESRKRI
ncbi:MAG TPA: hypothetical protein VKC61_00970 [Pyrinomonadaceae bacterium]|nr:hypothetical protein [Pyrinomonadaceae bacterium]